ncbi:hypothetical protein SK128_020036, partial [Halocaridina rubra]
MVHTEPSPDPVMHNEMYRFLLAILVFNIVGAFDLPLSFFQDDVSYQEVGPPVIIDVSQGRIVGQVKIVANYTFHSFESIPFAKPPVGALRFKDPEPADPWVGDLNATLAPPTCPQFIVVGDEDCLYLNVYTPVDSLNQTESLPVMVYIHGGAFYLGGSYFFRGVQPLVQHNVIMVTINYRLGVLGFLSTEDAAAPGNQGLKDQTLALQWVHDNIAAFGGDPDKITIFGESAGSASVHYQLITPYAS